MTILETPSYRAVEVTSEVADVTLINSWDGKTGQVVDFEIDGTPFSIGGGLE